MTLKEFQIDFPVTFQKFNTTKWGNSKGLEVLDRIYGFVESTPMIKINFFPEDETNYYCPELMIDNKRIVLNGRYTLNNAKKLVVSKALCFMEFGFVE